MNIPPETADDIRKRVLAAHRLGRRARIEALETETMNLKALARLLHEEVMALKTELMREETTRLNLPVLPK